MRTVRKVLAARIGRVEVALDDEGETPVRCKGGGVSARIGLGSFGGKCSPTHDAIAMLTLQARLHAAHALICAPQSGWVSSGAGVAGGDVGGWRAAAYTERAASGERQT